MARRLASGANLVDLRVPLLFNLRRDPYERAQHNANVYHDWVLSRVFLMSAMSNAAMEFLLTMKDFPPSQTPGSFNLDSARKRIEAMSKTEN